MSRACNECPFRAGAEIGYDADALETLDDGYEPRCHKVAGHYEIFSVDYPTIGRCHGHDAWARGDAGFMRPQLTVATPASTTPAQEGKP